MKSCVKVFESIPRSKLIFPGLRRPFVKGSNCQLEQLDLYWKFGSTPKINSPVVIKPYCWDWLIKNRLVDFSATSEVLLERAGILACCSKALSKFTFQFSSG